MNDKKKPERELLKWAVRSLVFFSLVLLLIFFVFAHPLFFYQGDAQLLRDLEKTYSLGNSTLGMTNHFLTPIIGALAVVTTFFAFLVQFKANEDQRNDIKRGRSETKFYELLRLHKENVNEIEIDGVKGREAFVKMYNEFKSTYGKAEKLFDNKKPIFTDDQVSSFKASKGQRNREAYVAIAYTLCFFGYYHLKESKTYLYPRGVNQGQFAKFMKHLQDENDFGDYSGNVSKLGHYYRHLYQMIKFVVTERDLLYEKKNKGEIQRERYQYIKTIRAQLSNHEQALIYFNSFFSAGRIWWEEEKDDDGNPIIMNKYDQALSYFLDFGIIKNLPFNLTYELGPDPVTLFKQKLCDRGYKSDYKNSVQKRDYTLKEKLVKLFEWGIEGNKRIETCEEKKP